VQAATKACTCTWQGVCELKGIQSIYSSCELCHESPVALVVHVCVSSQSRHSGDKEMRTCILR
jgi:hypothetical protein